MIGRRAKQRRWPADLTGFQLAGIVICGIGGTGRTILTAEIATRIRDRELRDSAREWSGALRLRVTFPPHPDTGRLDPLLGPSVTHILRIL